MGGGFTYLYLSLILLCFNAIGVKAADTDKSVKFNSDVRYSQWAINSRATSFNANTTKCGMATIKDGNVSKPSFGKDRLDYVPGLVAKSMIEAADYYQSFDWSKPWFLSVKEYGDKYYGSVEDTGGSLDNLNAVKLYIGLYNNTNATETDQNNAKTAISRAQAGLVAHDTNNSIKSGTLAGDAVVGGWFHKAAYNNQMWLDGAYMGSALLAQIVNFNGTGSSVFGSPTADWDMVTKQLNIVWNMCWNSNDKLMYHAFEANAGTGTNESKSHADTWAGLNGKTAPYTFHSAAYWGRANAWYLMALVDVLEAMKNAGQESTENYTTLKQHLAALAAGIAARQDSKTGGWYQVMNKDASFTASSYNSNWTGKPASVTNYIETSATAIFAAAYFKAVRLGLLSTSPYDYKTIAKNAFEGLVNNYTYLDNNGDMQIWGSCRSAGLGGEKDTALKGAERYRDGSNEYYLLGYDVPMVKQTENITEGKVLGGFIMAATEYERACQNQDSKQILFAKDLAPSYDFSTTAGTLDATAYGDGTVSYQWYKDDKAIADATSATYTPTEGGSYYCIATAATNSRSAGNNTIQTRTTTVTAKNNSNTDNGSTDNNGGSEVIYDFTNSVGTTSYGTSCTSTNGIITFSSNFSAKDGKYITIKPKTGGFKAGDVITLKGYCNSKKLSGVIIYSDVNGSRIFKSDPLATSTNNGSEFTYTIEKDCDALYLGRYGGGTTCLTSLQVNRPASSSNKTRLTASFERNADVVVNTTTTVTLPALTVKAGETTLAADQYTVDYKSNAEGVATLSDNNTITIKDLGIATITATVTPKDANAYEGTTATYQLSVKAPSPLNVSVMDVTINTTDAEVEQPVIKVYGDNAQLLKLGQDYTLAYEVSGDNNVSVDASGNFSVTKTGDKWTKGTSLITVTATPTDESKYTKGTLQFSYSVSEGKIKPVFLESFKDITINLHLDATSSKEITVPLIYDGEDVSSYFNYTYTIKSTDNTTSVTGNPLNFTPKTAGTYSVTVSAEPDPNGTNDYRDVYDKPEPITFKMNVDSKYQTISVDPDPKNIQMYAGTTRVAPNLTVTNGTTTLNDTEYTAKWFSTSPGVAKVDAKTGKIEAVSEGTANIRVVVTGENLESTTALITVEVDDPAMYRVKSTGETYGNQTRMWNLDKTMSVVLGGWLFPNNVTTNGPTSPTQGPSTEGLSAGYYWGPGATEAKWKLTGFDYYVAGDNNKNARQENGSNALPETTNIYSADFKSYQGTIKDKMFNVPCSGSFLEFNPATNGKVTAHIFQNGAFDASNEKISYRPQRRVFIMDEAGNFVESTAHIESTAGKPTGGIQDISNYKWDLNPKGKDTAPTIDQVRSHFNGIPETFDMTADGFKNNVYESLLSTDIVPNAAAGKGNGSLGWSVLADSPVTYTFNVKAGKTYYLYNFGSKIGFYGFSFDKDKTTPEVDQVDYADDQSNTIKATEAGHVARVTVNRKMTKGIWTTCVLPFSLNRQQVDAIFGPAYSATAKEGTQILYFDRVENGTVYFVRHAYNTIVAGKPFLIKPTKDVASINTAEVTEYPYVTIENTKPADWCSANGYAWVSSYSNDMIVKEGDGFISNTDGSFKNFVDESGILKGFRGYLKRLGTQAGAKPTMLKVLSSSNVDADNGGTTGIENLIITADGELMPANNRVYNINGQLVSEDASNFQSLPSGIYIINGKKYIK